MAAVIRAALEEDTVDTAQDVLVPVLSVVAAVVVAFLLAILIGILVRSLAKKSVVAADLARRAKRPLRAVLVVIAVWVALRISVPDATWESSGWMQGLGHVLLIALIGTATWLIGTLAFVVEDAALSRYRVDVKDNRHARRVRTQIQLLRRITVAILVVVAVAAVLLTFPGVSAFGASLLASAGVLSIVAGLAAQSSLANVFAGLQLAFTDAIRVDDVVIVEEEWGRIEEITLTYVVVHVWDDRRLILPSTYFTQTPFENWTRRAAELLGTVEMDVDWQVPVDDLRAELNRLLAATDLWDQRVGILQVTDAVNGWVRLRALASAVDAPTLFDLRCYLREGLVAYLQGSAPQGLPRTRIETTQGAALPTAPARPRPATGSHAAVEPRPETGQLDARLFTGSVEAKERSRSFAGPGQDVIAERESHAAEGRDEPEPATGRSSGGRRAQDAPGTAAVPLAGEGDATGAETTGTGATVTGATAALATGTGSTATDRAEPVGAATGVATAGSGLAPVAAEVPGAVPGAAAPGTSGSGTPGTAGTPATPPADAAPAAAPAAVPAQEGAGPITVPGRVTAPGATGEPPAAGPATVPAEPGTMVIPAYSDDPATAALPRADVPAAETTQAQEPVGEEPPAPPTRRSVRSAPVDPRTRGPR
jgi:small-conductance mechanosensitive channel